MFVDRYSDILPKCQNGDFDHFVLPKWVLSLVIASSFSDHWLFGVGILAHLRMVSWNLKDQTAFRFGDFFDLPELIFQIFSTGCLHIRGSLSNTASKTTCFFLCGKSTLGSTTFFFGFQASILGEMSPKLTAAHFC